MSHVSQIERDELFDLDDLREACKRCPETEFVEGQQTFAWYGTHVGDYPVPDGYSVKDMGKCDHAIKVRGARYEVGVRARGSDPSKCELAWDDYSSGGLVQAIGRNAGRLTMEYDTIKAERAARGARRRIREVEPDREDRQGWRVLRVDF